MKHISIPRAVSVGTLWVNIPVVLLLAAPLSAYLFLVDARSSSDSATREIGGFAVFFLGFALAWIWWSIMVPQWRLWAYERVEDIAALESRAVQAGLIWPAGHFFERTEFRSEATKARLAELVLRKTNPD